MTEPIKLPDMPFDLYHGIQDCDQYNAIRKYTTDAVEQATADLRAELAAMTDHWYKARAERDEVRAELARLTTLRAHTGHTHTGLVLWHFASGAATVSRKAQAGSIGWTPLPPVKEADK